MNLDEAIQSFKDEMEKQTALGHSEHIDNLEQMSEWLRELKAYRENTCEDAISRQAAIEAIEALQRPIMREESNYYQFKFSGMSEAREAVENLPSVTPQHSDAEIQKIQEMEQAEIQKAYELGKAEMQPCEDAISRDKVIVQLSHLLSDWDDDWNVGIRKCIETVKSVESVTPQQRTGRWVEYVEPNDAEPLVLWRCENCDTVKRRKTSYCPECGTKMEVEE